MALHFFANFGCAPSLGYYYNLKLKFLQGLLKRLRHDGRRPRYFSAGFETEKCLQSLVEQRSNCLTSSTRLMVELDVIHGGLLVELSLTVGPDT